MDNDIVVIQGRQFLNNHQNHPEKSHTEDFNNNLDVCNKDLNMEVVIFIIKNNSILSFSCDFILS